jgi:hypothetical protein
MTAAPPAKRPEKPPFPLHPFLLAVAPLWAMYAANIDSARLESFLRPAACLLAFAAAGFLLLRPLMPDPVRRGFLVYVLLVPAHGYDSLYRALQFAPGVWRHVLALGVLAAVLAFATLALRRLHVGLNVLTVFLNVSLAILLIIEGVRAVGRSSAYLLGEWRTPAEEITRETLNGQMRTSARPPDIYYIILDGYARADVLAEVYQFDNSEFIRRLTDKGFYIPAEGRCNYPFTYLSLASSLNGSYLDALQATAQDGTLDYRVLDHLIDDNAAARQLRQAGYTYVFISSDFEATWSSSAADVCACDQVGFGQVETHWANRTPLALWPEAFRWLYDPFEAHRRKMNSQLAALAAPPATGRPRFVFAHLMAPHLPFVFGADGEPVQQTLAYSLNDRDHPSRALYIEGYRAQLHYVNARIEEVVDEILAQSTTPPIIILQADHGPNAPPAPYPYEYSKERYSIFAAYYLPGEGAGKMYPSVTPVNTFRLIFNVYFGMPLELLPDVSYSSLTAQVYP